MSSVRASETDTTSEAPARPSEPGVLPSWLPQGRTISEADWTRRHRAILILLWAHVAVIPVYALIQGFSLPHSLFEASPVAAGAAVATWSSFSQRVRMSGATFGLLSASAVLVHISGGYIEMHFHFFVMVPVIALYQAWFPFLFAVAYVLVHHGVLGTLFPDGVYNHPAAIANPWGWAAVHALFIAGICAVCLVTWRLNEIALERRKKAEHEARDAASVLSATLEATADGILVVDPDGRITTYNRRFAEMWRIPEEILATEDDDQALAHVLDQLVDPDGFLQEVRRLYGDPEAESYDELKFKDGRIFERYSRPHRVAGRSMGRVWSFHDVTKRIRDEERLKEAMERDREAVERLKMLDESKRLLLNAVSHEIRTPLSSILGFAKTLEDHGDRLDPETHREYLARLGSNAERLQQLVLDLFDLDRISRGTMEPRRQPTDVRELIVRVLQDLDVADRRIELDIVDLNAHVDPGMLERILENLISNALKHTPQDVPVTIRAYAEDGALHLVVEDRGDGVPDDLKEAVFEPFRQGTIPTHSPGTGIGLSIVERFAALHGGRAWVEDHPGGGASFHVLIPQTAPAEATEPPKA